MSALPQHFSGAGGGVASGATQRAVMGMSIGAIKSWQDRRERVWKEALDEYDQQFQAGFVIETNNTGAWAELRINFNLAFVHDPTARDSDYDTPIFTYGFELTGGVPLFMSAWVKEWWKDQQSNVIGALLIVGGHNPASGKQVKCTGIIHLNFQGYGGPISDETQDSE